MAFMKLTLLLLEPEGVVSVAHRFVHLRPALVLRLVITFSAISFDIFVSKTS